VTPDLVDLFRWLTVRGSFSEEGRRDLAAAFWEIAASLEGGGAVDAGTLAHRVAEASKPRRGPHRPLKRGRKKHARLTPEQRRELLDRFARGEKGPALAREFGVADSYPYVMSRRRRPEPEALEEAAS
jgi:hypothetical protein